MNTPELIAFLKKARLALRDTGLTDASKGQYESLIFVKENCCEDGPEGKAVEFLDEEDSSLTR
jgi:protein N-terminal methyltransferase